MILPWGVVVCILFLLFLKCVLIWSVYMSIFGCIYHVLIINLRLQYEGTPKYLGETVTGLKFGLWKTQQGSCVAEENSWQGCQCRCRRIPAILLHMHSAFPAEMGEQMILTSFGDVIISQLMHLGIYKRKAHKSLRAVIWVSGTE